MLILTRRPEASIIINGGTSGEIRVKVLGYDRGQVRLGITAPETMTINREEIEEKIKMEGKPEPVKRPKKKHPKKP